MVIHQQSTKPVTNPYLTAINEVKRKAKNWLLGIILLSITIISGLSITLIIANQSISKLKAEAVHTSHFQEEYNKLFIRVTNLAAQLDNERGLGDPIADDLWGMAKPSDEVLKELGALNEEKIK